MRRLAALGAIIISLAGAGIASAAVQPAHEQKGPKSCYSTCATHTSMWASSHKLLFGSEQSEVFTVVVTPKSNHGAGVPTGTVQISAEGIALCTVTLSAGSGACSPTSSALAVRNQPYRVIGAYSGDGNFAASTSHHVMVKVFDPNSKCQSDGHGKGDCGKGDDDGGDNGHGHEGQGHGGQGHGGEGGKGHGGGPHGG